MPLRRIIITESAELSLRSQFGIKLESGTYTSDKGDIGAIIFRYNPSISRQTLRMAYSLAIECGCVEENIEEVPSDSYELEPDSTQQKGPHIGEEPSRLKQLTFNLEADPPPRLLSYYEWEDKARMGVNTSTGRRKRK